MSLRKRGSRPIGTSRASTMASASTTRKDRICIVTGELAGPDFNGGIGTSNRGLALELYAAGHAVDILYTNVEDGHPFCFRGSFAEQVCAYQREGIRLRCIWHGGNWDDWLAKSYRVMEHLIADHYDLVFFDDTQGNGYYPLLARATGNRALSSTSMCVKTHSATQWIANLSETRLTSIEEIRLFEIERRAIELADVVISPSAYILEKYREYGWKLPKDIRVLPNLVPGLGRGRPKRRISIRELVFFGRLETRKGLWLFCSALDQMKSELADLRVTFLGKCVTEDGLSTGYSLLARSAAWPFEARFLFNYDREQALHYLLFEGRLAVMPSPEDNSPGVIVECLQHGIPFVASSGSGGEELLAEQSKKECLFKPTVEGLTAKLREVVKAGALAGDPAFDRSAINLEFQTLVRRLLKNRSGQGRRELIEGKDTAVKQGGSVSLVVAPRGEGLQETISRASRLQVERCAPAKIHLFVLHTRDLIDAHASRFDDSNVSVHAADEFSKVVRSIAEGPPQTVVIHHLSQMISEDWLERADLLFASGEGVDAVSGMVAGAAEGAEVLDQQFSQPRRGSGIKAFLSGSTRALFPLSRETNSGFVLTRSNVLSSLAEHGPLDHRSRRFKRMEDWIHELLMVLTMEGRCFELIPDLTAEDTLVEEPEETFRLGPFMRTLANDQLGLAVGSDTSLLTRLAVDTTLAKDRRQAAFNCLRLAEDRTGLPHDSWSAHLPRRTKLLRLAALAHSVGQIELGAELGARASLSESFGGTDAGAPDLIRAAIAEIGLFELVSSGRFEGINLLHEWSFRLNRETHEIRLHPNVSAEPRAGLEFPSLDLSGANYFSCVVKLPHPEAPKVRGRVDLLTLSLSTFISHEFVLDGGQSKLVQLEVPPGLRAPCKVRLSVELRNFANTAIHSGTLWADPRFTARPTSGPLAHE